MGVVDGEGQFSNAGEEALRPMAYVYPDLKTAIVGTFNKGMLVRSVLDVCTYTSMALLRFISVW